MNYAAGFLSADVSLELEAEFDLLGEVDVHDIGDELPFDFAFEDDCMSFDATDMALAVPAGGIQGVLSDDDGLEAWFAQQVESPTAVRARRRRQVVANDNQLHLFA